MLRFLPGICMTLFFAASLSAQQLSFNTYTPADGLIDARVQKIFQDSRGILYFLTRDGFCSFDGQRFQHYTQTNNQPLSVVNDIIEEADGSLLVSALTGLYRLQQHRLWKDTVLSRQLREPGPIIPAGNNEWVILSNSGSMLYNHQTIQPLFINENNKTPRPLVLDKAACSGRWIIGIQVAPDNHTSSIVFYNRDTRNIRSLPPAAESTPILYTGNQLYIKQAGEWKLFYPADQFSEQSRLFNPTFTIPSSLTYFFIDRQQNKWLFNGDNTITFIRHTTGEKVLYNKSNGLPDNVTGIFQDRENNYWLMVAGKGVYKIVQSAIQQWPLITSPAQSISSINNTLCIRSNSILTILNGSSSLQKKIPEKPGLMQVMFSNNQWLAFYNNGWMEAEDGTSLRFAGFEAGTRQLSARVTLDKESRLLTAGDFLTVITNNKLIAGTALPYFTDNIAAGDDGLYWCFARNGSVAAYELSNNVLKPAATYTDNSFSTRCVLHWNKDSFYIGTRNNGIILVRASRNGYQKLGTISTADGLSNNFVTGLLKIKNDQLLVSTVTGLDKVHLSANGNNAEQLFSRIGLFTGVPAMAQRNDSSVIVLTDDGKLYDVQTNFSQAPDASPSLFFHSITVNGSEVNAADNASFAYNRNNFHFTVSAPGFVDEKNIRFIFLLNGETIIPGAATRSGEASFSNLQPGRYTVEVTAIFPGNGAVRKTISYSFHINKPFWKTTVFITALTAFILLLIYGLFRIQLRRKLQRKQVELEKEKAIARERSRIASDMHDDLGAGISTIKYLSQSAPFISAEIQKENSLKIAAQADELVDKMNDIIWAMNETNDTLDNLVFYTKAWVAGFAQQHNIDAVITIPSSIPSTIIRGEKRQHIFLIIKEALHNIIKHAGATKLWLSIALKDDKLEADISDNGRGFDTGKMSGGNGLANMQKRIKAVNGLLEIHSGEGTQIHFSVPV